MKISVIGAGYVGLTTAACLAEIGHSVRCSDNDDAKLDMLRRAQMPFFEPHLEEMVSRNCRAGRLQFESPESAVRGAEAVFICVGTPPLDNGDADLSAVANVARTIAQHTTGHCLVIEKSTVPVQTGQQLKRQLQLYSHKELRCDLVSNPEFLREGSAIRDFFHPDRIVIGVEREEVATQLREIYRPILEQTFKCPVHAECTHAQKPAWIVTDTNSSELIKHASNSFLAMKISFINMVADLCEAVGADVTKVALGMGLDPRIGPAFLNPGIGFGGFCFPKDVQAFVGIASKAGCDFSLLKEVEAINKRRVPLFVEKVRKELWVIRGRKIAVWGLAYKPNTDDVRLAPALEILRSLVREGATVSAFDPRATEKAKAEVPDVRYCSSPYEAAQDADAILITTEWEEFCNIDWDRLRKVVARPLVIDGRNMFDPTHLAARGFQYVSIGRHPALTGDEDSSVDPGHAVASGSGETPARAYDMPKLPTYALITPARNEAQFIEMTIRSMVAQTVAPLKWVIVSDGSTDGTDEIVNKYTADYPWIELIRMPERRERHFAGKVHAFNAGYARVKELNPEIIGNLDADVSFEEGHFEFLITKMGENPNLGVAGAPFREGSYQYDYRFTNVENVWGGCQLFRRECFEQIGGYMPLKGGCIDHVAVLSARMKGWQTRTFAEKVCLHHRQMGTALHGGLMARYRLGAKDYSVGNHPAWELFRTFYQMTQRPFIIGGLALAWGYTWSLVRRKEIPVSPDLVLFVRREQMQRLKRFFQGRTLIQSRTTAAQNHSHVERSVSTSRVVS